MLVQLGLYYIEFPTCCFLVRVKLVYAQTVQKKKYDGLNGLIQNIFVLFCCVFYKIETLCSFQTNALTQATHLCDPYRKIRIANQNTPFQRGPVQLYNGPFAASGHMVQNSPCWRASCTLGHPEQSDFIKTNLHFLCFECPSA